MNMPDWFVYAYITIASLFSFFLGYLLAKKEMRKTLHSVCIITFKSNDRPHMVVATIEMAKIYCQQHPQYTWESWSVNRRLGL